LPLQYLVLTLGDAREATPTINKSLNPEWHTTLDFPITAQQTLLLEACCWDKDRFGKDYMGEFDVILEDVFVNAQTVQEPRWFPLESRRSGKKKSHVTGDIQIQFSLVDASNPNASADDIMRKWMSFTTNTPSPDEDEDDEELLRSESADMENAQTDDEDSSDEPQDESKKAEKREKRRKKLRLARLKRKANKLRAYEFSDKTEVAGVLFLEITKVTDLPPEKNGASLDPFPSRLC
jgi:phosphatidylserine decarboxylase